GSGTFVATLNGGQVKSGTGSQTVATVNYVAGASTPMAFALAPTASEVTAPGSSARMLTRTDSSDSQNPVATVGATDTLTTQSATGPIGSVTANSNGTSPSLHDALPILGSGTFVATLNGGQVKSGTGSQTVATVNYVAGAATHLAFGVEPSDTEAGAPIT